MGLSCCAPCCSPEPLSDSFPDATQTKESVDGEVAIVERLTARRNQVGRVAAGGEDAVGSQDPGLCGVGPLELGEKWLRGSATASDESRVGGTEPDQLPTDNRLELPSRSPRPPPRG